jgi:AraC-like DNA-binding protein
VPVAVGGRPVGTWIAGPVFCRQPTQADFRSVVQQLAASGMSDEVSRIEAAFFGHPVVSADQFLAVRQLLVLFAGHVARHLSEEADRAWLVSRCGEPTYVTRAKDLVHAQITQRISLPQVAAAVHVHPGQLSREFRAATGVPFPEYVARLRVERAKALLADPSMRVSHVAYAAGFGSIPQFSAAFRHCLGKSPAQYRATQPQRPGV